MLVGLSLGILAAGIRAATDQTGADPAAVEAGARILGICGLLAAVGGVALAATGAALGRRRPVSRWAALLLAVPNLVFVPFGTALSVYAFWVLLNDEARREFGRPERGATATSVTS